MKRIVFFSIILGLLSSCNSYDDYYMNQDSAPVINFYKNGTTLTESIDSVKVSKSLAYSFQIQHREALKLSLQSNITDQIIVTKDSIIIRNLKNVEDGLYSINCYAEDLYNKRTEKEIQVYIFNNLAPVAQFTYSIDESNSRIININASTSFDKDAKWGGKIAKYEYLFDNIVHTETVLSLVHFVFNASGNKQVRLRVQDNNGLWSEYVTQTIAIL